MTQAEWEKLHTCSSAKGFPSSFSETLVNHWLMGIRNQIPYNQAKLSRLSEEYFSILKKQNISIYAYTNRTVSLILRDRHDEALCIGLFNKDGILLKLYGKAETVSHLSERGITRLSNWSHSSAGANAVSIGLATNRAQITEGPENYTTPLRHMAVYFSPIITEDSSGSVSLCQGGIAIIVPAEKAHTAYSLLANALSYDINLHLFMSGSIAQAYSSETSGVLNIDLNIVTGKRSITYHDQNVFNSLGVPCRDMSFHSVDELIDPLPANKSFWSIVDNQEIVSNRQLTLSIGGTQKHLSISTEPYSQPHLQIYGTRIFFTSTEFLSSTISRSIGNQAVTTFSELLGKSNTFKAAMHKARIYASTSKNILITGEASTGRTSFAQAIHNASSRTSGPFILVDCASLSRDHLEEELFGLVNPETHSILHFGKLELAKGGTLFLKNFDMLPLSAQAILNNVIEQGTYCRVNEATPIKLDVRFIASAWEDLANLANKHHFRADLYYRMDVLKLPIPPLRDRKQDIPILADYFIRQLSKQSQFRDFQLSPESKKLLVSLPWDGNIRELRNTVEGVALISLSPTIEPDDIARYIGSSGIVRQAIAESNTRHKVSKVELEQALVDTHFNKMAAAQQLGISRRTLYRYLEKYGIQ